MTTNINSDEAWAYLYATLCFFGGIAITAVFDAVLHHVQGKVFQHKSSSSSSSSPQHVEEEEQKQASHQMKDHKQQQNGSDSDKTRTASDTSSVTDHAHVDVDVDDDGITRESSQVAPTGEDDGNNGDQVVGHGGHLIASLYQNQEENNVHDSKALIRMGIFAGIALAFHVRTPTSFFSLSLSLFYFISIYMIHNLFNQKPTTMNLLNF